VLAGEELQIMFYPAGYERVEAFIEGPPAKTVQRPSDFEQERVHAGYRAVDWPLYTETAPMCRKYGQEEESSCHTLGQCPGLAWLSTEY
jgi:hypothetical protein